MVIEVSKEVDIVRIGIDRYSLKTGLKLKTVMDLSLRVMKEPRGFIRVLQMVMAILAFSTTSGFSTALSFLISCGTDNVKETYDLGYPFQFTSNPLIVSTCNESEDHVRLPYDFSSTAEFFVAVGVISFLYTIIILVVYIFFHQTYTNDPKAAVIDLGISAILTIFWLAGSSAWSQGVVDMKYYFDADNLFGILRDCQDDKCEMESEGHFATLNVSLIFGFANFLLWLGSLWFIYKETVFHSPVEVESQTQNQSKGDGRV